MSSILLKAAGALRAQVLGADQAAAGQMIDELSRTRAGLAGEPGGSPQDEAGLAGEPGGSPEDEAAPAQGGGPAQGRAPSDADTRLLRVPAKKIDHLLDVVAEIMRFRQELAQPAAAAAAADADADADADVTDDAEAAARMLDELKDTAVGLRTLPLATMSGALPRVAATWPGMRARTSTS